MSSDKNNPDVILRLWNNDHWSYYTKEDIIHYITDDDHDDGLYETDKTSDKNFTTKSWKLEYIGDCNECTAKRRQ